MHPGIRAHIARATACLAAIATAGCASLKFSYTPPPGSHQPQTSLDPQVKHRLRDASAGTGDQLALAAIKLAEEKLAAPADIAAYAAELKPAEAPFLTSAMSDMFPSDADAIARAVALAIPSAEQTVAPSRATGHTFFNWR